jgi:serine/threonine protein kinase
MGGFGIVYIAWDSNLDIRVAIKEFLAKEYAARSPNHVSITPYTGSAHEDFSLGVGKFLDEAKALARFQDHPGIVTVHESFRANNTAYMVMQYLDGMTLKEYLKRQPGEKIAFALAVKTMTPVMDALREVHNAGFVHRDISPDNIFLTNQKQVKLLDFGSARYAIGEHSKSLTSVLKHGYAPVEQYSTKGNQGPWSDVYAVCATLYRCVTGFVPPDAMDRVQGDSIRSPKQLGIDMPAGGEWALMKGLSLKAADRFENIQQLQRAFGTEGTKIDEQQLGQASDRATLIQAIQDADTSKSKGQLEGTQTTSVQGYNIIACPHCGAKNKLYPGDDPTVVGCGNCKRTLIIDSSEAAFQAMEPDYALFIGINVDKYLMIFRKFNVNGNDRFEATWNWPAALVPFFWLLYRKLYAWVLLVLFLSLIPYVHFILMVIIGITGNYIYYKHVKEKILEINRSEPPSSRSAKIAYAGGVNNIFTMMLVIIPLVGIIAAIAIPQFTAYRTRGYCAAAKADAKNAYTASQAYLTDNPGQQIYNTDVLSSYGFKRINDECVVQINMLSYYGGYIATTHPSCNKVFIIDKKGDIIEKVKGEGGIDEAVAQSAVVVQPPAPAPAPTIMTAQEYFNAANSMLVNGKYTNPQQAIAYLNEAIRIKPDYAGAYNNRGIAFINIGEYEKAIKDFNEAIRWSPHNATPYKNLAIVYYRTGFYQKVCYALEKACENGDCSMLEEARRQHTCN